MIDPTLVDDLMLAAGRLTDDLGDRLRHHAVNLAVQLAREPLLFRCPAPGVFEVGDRAAPTVVHCDILAAGGAQIALLNPNRHDLVRAADFAEPGAAYPDKSARNGLRRFAEYLESVGQLQLSSAVLRVRVVRGYLVAPPRLGFDLVE